MKKLISCIALIFALALAGCGSDAEALLHGSTFTWKASVTNEDGTCLEDLDHYNFYYGSASGTYTANWTIPLTDTALSCVDTGVPHVSGCSNEIQCTWDSPKGLVEGLWYFIVTAVDNAILENESQPSNEVTREFVDTQNPSNPYELE